MSALDDDGDWHAARRTAPRDASSAIGKDQNGRPVYADKCVVIPGTKRPDGSRRKDQRVRAEQLPDGSWKSFVPQEEVERYSTARHRGGPAPSGPPGSAPPGSGAPAGAAAPSKSAKKNAARKAAKERAAAEAAAAVPPAPAAAPPAAADDDPAKRAKALRKRLKQINELEVKIAGGHAPSPEQAEKVARGEALRAELSDVEARLAAVGI